MGSDRIPASGSSGGVVEKRCIGCGECVSACAYGAVALVETGQGDKAVVDPALCQGDGLCSSLCATGAIELDRDTDEDILRQIDAALGSG